jgi:hypothetical protein
VNYSTLSRDAPIVWHFGEAVWIFLKGLKTPYTLKTGRYLCLMVAKNGGQLKGNLAKVVFLTETEFASLQNYVISLPEHGISNVSVPSMWHLSDYYPNAPSCLIEALLERPPSHPLWSSSPTLSGDSPKSFFEAVGAETYEEVTTLLSL